MGSPVYSCAYMPVCVSCDSVTNTATNSVGVCVVLLAETSVTNTTVCVLVVTVLLLETVSIHVLAVIMSVTVCVC